MAPSARLKKFSSISFYLPAAALLLLVLAYPIGRTAFLSLFQMKLATAFHPEFAGIGNFRRLIDDSRFLNSLTVTATFSAASVTLEFGLGLLLALSAERLARGRGLVRSVF